MITVELIERIKNALADDEYIRNWCVQTFGRPHTVFIGIDSQNLPRPEDDYPFIAVLADGQIRGTSTRGVSWEIMLAVGVSNREEVETDNVRIKTGFSQVTALRELAEEAIYTARLGKTETRAAPVIRDGYPDFIVQFSILIKDIKTSRHGMPG